MVLYHHDYIIEWPVSKSMEDYGFTDSFRKVIPKPRYSFGYTWSPRFTEDMQQRIDYLYYKGDGLQCVNTYVKGYGDTEWPSDHAALVAVYRFYVVK